MTTYRKVPVVYSAKAGSANCDGCVANQKNRGVEGQRLCDKLYAQDGCKDSIWIPDTDEGMAAYIAQRLTS